MAKTIKIKRNKKVEQPTQKAVQAETTAQPVSSYLPAQFALALAIVALLSSLLIAMFANHQLVNSDRLIKEANNRSQRTVSVPFTRGQILDRDGSILSVSVPLSSITIDPQVYFDTLLQRNNTLWRVFANEMGLARNAVTSNVKKYLDRKNYSAEKIDFDPRSLLNTNSEGYWQLLADSTGIEKAELQAKLYSPNSKFLQLENQHIEAERQKWQAIAKSVGIKYTDLMDRLYKSARSRFLYIARHQPESIAEYIRKLDVKGTVIQSEFRRFYPIAEEASQLIGFTDSEDKKGIEGLERSFNSLLVGEKGQKIIRRDKRGNLIETISDKKQYDPQDIVLSIDEELQSMVYKEIKKAVQENKAESGTAVLVDVQTGEILAMANAPSFNPNNRSNYKPELVRNRAITDTFEPGSTVKPLVVLTALQNGVTYRDEVINTRPFVVNGHTIKDVAPRESLTLTGILQKSSNIGVSRLALRMPSTALVDTYSKVGFGKDTGLGLGEQRGTNGDRKRWADIERATLSYGYGLNVTPLQLARAYATLGSFGIYRPLSITKVDPPVIGERVLPEKITKDVVHMMESVAQKGEGGHKAAVDGYRVAVKTGTARKLEKGQYVEKYIAYTAGLAPASDPRFALVVLINEPTAGAYYGGSVSAPLFSSIMGYTLKAKNIKPDNLTDNEHAVRNVRANPIN